MAGRTAGAAIALTGHEQLPSAIFRVGEARQGDIQRPVCCRGRENLGIGAIPAAVAADHGALELGQCLPDAGFADHGAAKGKGKQFLIVRQSLQAGDQRGYTAGACIPAHLDRVDDGLDSLRLHRGGAAIPEHRARSPVTDIAQAHGMGRREGSPGEAVREAFVIVKAERLFVAGCAGDAGIDAQLAIVKQHPAQQRNAVAVRIVDRRIVERTHRRVIICRQIGRLVIGQIGQIDVQHSGNAGRGGRWSRGRGGRWCRCRCRCGYRRGPGRAAAAAATAGQQQRHCHHACHGFDYHTPPTCLHSYAG